MRKIWVILLAAHLTGCLNDVQITESDVDDTDFSGQIRRGSTSFLLSWTPPTQYTDGSALTDLAGYRIYYGLQSGRYTETVRINTTDISSYVVDNVERDTYFAVMTAINREGQESDYTRELAFMSD